MSATTADTNTSSTSSFVAALVTAGITVGVCCVFWLILHGRQSLLRVYQPRTYLAPVDQRPQTLPSSPISWWRRIFSFDDREILETNGPDAYFFLRYLKVFGLTLLAPLFVLTFAACLPASAISPTNGKDGLNQFAFGNVPKNKELRQLAHFFVAIIYMLYTLFLLWREYRHYVDVRERWLMSPRERALPSSRTLCLINVPDQYNSESGIKELAAMVAGMNGSGAPRPSGFTDGGAARSGVVRVWQTRKMKDLEKAFERRDTACTKVEGAIGGLLKKALKLDRKGKTPEKLGTVPDSEGGNIVDRYVPIKKQPSWREKFLRGPKYNLTTAPEHINTLNKEVDQLRVKNDEYPLGTVCFVKFSTPEEAINFARNGRKADKKLRTLRMSIKPVPDDIVWGNVSMGAGQRIARTILSWAITVGIIITWAIPVAFVGVVSNIDAMCNKPWLAWICKIPSAVLGIIKGVLPAALLAVLFMLLPIVLRILIKLQGEVRKSEIELKLFTRFWLFQVIHGFLIVTLASGLISALSNIDGMVGQIPTLLATKLPDASLFFLTFVLVTTWAAAAKTMARIVPFVMYLLRNILAGGTSRKAFDQKYAMDSFNWATVWPPVCLIICITIVYAVIQPFITVICLVAVVMLYASYKYCLLYTTDQPAAMETGGLYYIKAMRTVFVSLYLAQICLAGLFFLKTTTLGYICGGVIAGVALITAITQFAFDHFLFKKETVRYGRGVPNGSATHLNAHPSEKIYSNDDTDGAGPLSENARFEKIHAFDNPAMWKKQPVVWIADDPLGIGRYEADKLNRAGVYASTQYAHMDEKGAITVDRSPPDEDWDGGKDA